MRRLGQELGWDPMGLYRTQRTARPCWTASPNSCSNGAGVLSGMSGDWQAQLHAHRPRLRVLALRHPNVVPLLVTSPLSTPLGLRPRDTAAPGVDSLPAGGRRFRPADALHVYRAYYGFLYGHILNELQEFVVDPEENEALLRLGLHRLPAREFPHIRALGRCPGRLRRQSRTGRGHHDPAERTFRAPPARFRGPGEGDMTCAQLFEHRSDGLPQMLWGALPWPPESRHCRAFGSPAHAPFIPASPVSRRCLFTVTFRVYGIMRWRFLARVRN